MRVKNHTLAKMRVEHKFISGSSRHLTRRFCYDELGQGRPNQVGGLVQILKMDPNKKKRHFLKMSYSLFKL